MRLKILVLALVASLVAVSAAVAKDHPGKGPKPKTGAGCKPAVTVMLAGTLAADVDPQDGDASFVLTVKNANRHGRAYKQAGTATILVDSHMKVRRQGAKTLGALAPNDRAQLAAELLASLDENESDVESAWAAEIQRRAVEARKNPDDDDDWSLFAVGGLVRIQRRL